MEKAALGARILWAECCYVADWLPCIGPSPVERRNNMTDSKDKKKSVWDIVLKVIIAALSALAGALGANAVNIN